MRRHKLLVTGFVSGGASHVRLAGPVIYTDVTTDAFGKIGLTIPVDGDVCALLRAPNASVVTSSSPGPARVMPRRSRTRSRVAVGLVAHRRLKRAHDEPELSTTGGAGRRRVRAQCDPQQVRIAMTMASLTNRSIPCLKA